jgi:hypothetical protein
VNSATDCALAPAAVITGMPSAVAAATSIVSVPRPRGRSRAGPAGRDGRARQRHEAETTPRNTAAWPSSRSVLPAARLPAGSRAARRVPPSGTAPALPAAAR